ncbi:MAG TPA: hypothetical protein DDX39_08975 [Bacteroidales bacterium]|nr:MAG: hypothetical protein A2W98_06220 [Bacteroidetes bacterium GWF2_33_38]OFY70760.1 MAG: hypothetical protein A2265_00280 [Bacteroidetes bacterium RIFOXYA12_FULL_33_9]OFY85958.1 MAG: hypothetical protein A2236_00725 [Bacteroidetes bacterium RIFOXYA2_FULL_33_7]HBF88760.1 hypothetical protein [Bacteroidales bacterium]
MITYSFNTKSNLLYVTFDEIITFAEIIDYLNEFRELDNLPLDLKLFYDVRKANFDFKLEDVATISKHAELVTEKYNTVKTVFLVDKPKHTALSQVFTETETKEKTTRKYFSTEEAAIKWLDSE